MKKLILLLLFPLMVSAKFHQGKLMFNDGTSKNGYIELPEYPDDKKIKFRSDEKGKTEKFEIDLIKSFEIKNDKNVIVKYATIYLANPKPFTKSQFKLDDHKSWVKIEKEGKLNIVTASSVYSPGTGTGGSTTTYIQKENDKYAYFIADGYGGFKINMNGFSVLKNYLGTIFEKDCPQLVNLIYKDDISKKGYEYIIELYENNCGK